MKGIVVWTVFHDVLRAYNMITIFSNPGSIGKLEGHDPPVGRFTDSIILHP